MSLILDGVTTRRSFARVGAGTPSHAELLPLITAAGRVADHASLRPWRFIELRGQARERLGAAFVESAGLEGDPAERLAAKPLRAELLIAIVASRKQSDKVEKWEQDATAAGVAHALSLLLSDAGWGVMWRTGAHTRSEAVHRLHALLPNEVLLGWLYVGSIPEDARVVPRAEIDAAAMLSVL